MEKLLIIFTAGAIFGGIASHKAEYVAADYAATCARSDEWADGVFPSLSWDCKLADVISWDMDVPERDVDFCVLADMYPTDANIEACTGEPIDLAFGVDA